MENKQTLLKYVVLYVLLLILFIVTLMLRKGWRSTTDSLHKELLAYQSEVLLKKQDMETEESDKSTLILDKKRVETDQALFLKFLDEEVLIEGTSADVYTQSISLGSSLKLDPVKNSFLMLYRPMFSRLAYLSVDKEYKLPTDKNKTADNILTGYRVKMEHGSVTSYVLKIEEDVYSYISYVPLTLQLINEKDGKTDTVYYDTYVTYTIDSRGHIRNLEAFERYNGKLVRPQSIEDMIAQKETQTEEAPVDTETETEASSASEPVDTTEAMPSANE